MLTRRSDTIPTHKSGKARSARPDPPLLMDGPGLATTRQPVGRRVMTETTPSKKREL